MSVCCLRSNVFVIALASLLALSLAGNILLFRNGSDQEELPSKQGAKPEATWP